MGNPNLYKNLLFLLMLIIGSISVVIIAMETNIYHIQPGSEKTIHIDVQSETEGFVGGGYILLERNSKSPLGLEYISFANDDYHQFFTISEDEDLQVPIFIRIPPDLQGGKYYFNTKIVYENSSIETERFYRVR